MEEELLKKRSDLQSEYRILLNRLKEIEYEKTEYYLQEQERAKNKSIFYKTFRKSKYLMELEKLKAQINLTKSYFHQIEEVKQIKMRILEINQEVVKINLELEEFKSQKRM